MATHGAFAPYGACGASVSAQYAATTASDTATTAGQVAPPRRHSCTAAVAVDSRPTTRGLPDLCRRRHRCSLICMPTQQLCACGRTSMWLRPRAAPGQAVVNAFRLQARMEAREVDADRSETQTQSESSSQMQSQQQQEEEEARKQVILNSVSPQRNEDARLARERMREQSMAEYEMMKRELVKLTLSIGGLGTLYCLLGFSVNSAISFALGSVFSCVYLLQLIQASDTMSPDRVPPEFLKRPRRQGLISALDTVGSAKRVLSGSLLSLTSPRLLLPGALVGVWVAAASGDLAGGPDAADTLHLQLAPLLFGFFSYKAAVLTYTFRDAKDFF